MNSTAWDKAQRCLLFKVITVGYSEGILRRIGLIQMIILGLKMKMLGYFLLITKRNLVLSLTQNNMQFIVIMVVWLFLEEDLIFAQE